jgi:putative FmdB family regulatory protein
MISKSEMNFAGGTEEAMPIYEYVCEKCSHHLEIMQKMSDKPLTKCPECKGKLEKIFSQTSFQLKGSGWYATDYTSRPKSEKGEKVEKGEKKETTTTCATTGGACATGNCDN